LDADETRPMQAIALDTWISGDGKHATRVAEPRTANKSPDACRDATLRAASCFSNRQNLLVDQPLGVFAMI
jgi:hypothetical protein